jgi:GNAT superfamily N-acetyltransferase
MALDLARTALQIDGMAVELRAREDRRRRRLANALGALEGFNVDDYVAWREQADRELIWNTPTMTEAPGARHDPPPPPDDHCVAAVDGSHIDIDRHLAARCFLINTGHSVLTYGSEPNALLGSEPRLYARDDELVISDPGSEREQSVEGAVLGARRAVEEIRKLAEIVAALPKGTPTLALMDGSLLTVGLVAPRNQDFVLRELVEEGFAAALDELAELASERPLAVASYISLPRHSEVVRALQATVCPYGDGERYRCGRSNSGREPCEGCVGGVLDREVFAQVLAPGQRSAVFGASSPTVERYYRGHEIGFFYVNVGEEVGRVELPAWVAEGERSLALAHSLVVDQCGRGRGYPVALMEAHEQAAVAGSDRRYFVEVVERALREQGVAVYTSEKARSKRMRWL